jgi:hypothetical protein
MINVELEPGNATRYNLMIAENDSHVLVSWLYYSDIAGPSMSFRKGHSYNIDYVADKMRKSSHDIACIVSYLRNHYDVRVRMPREFDQNNGVYIGSPSPEMH